MKIRTKPWGISGGKNAPTLSVALATILAAILAVAPASCRSDAPGGRLAETVVIGAGGEWELNGLLTIPAAASATSPVPAVVLVHGSGPADMDLTVGENRPFLDIAEHLSANGIAALRYDKRTFVHGQRMVEVLGGELTVWEETMEDAILAADLLRADPRVDPGRVFMLGISMGGMLAPRIQVESGAFDGLILMAATPRLLTDIMLEQFRTQADLTMEDGPGKDLQLVQLDTLAGAFNSIPDMGVEESKTVPVMGSIAAFYFKDMALHPFADQVPYLDVPVLVMQGGRDFQVLADVDFPMIVALFSGRDNAEFRLYEDLNHLFMPSSATNFVEHAGEIMGGGGTVDGRALADITDWILAR